jgi:hypothetical protein
VFARCSASGLNLVRWFMLCDGRAGIRFDDRGQPLGLDDACWRDVDAALEAAATYRLKLLFVLFDFLWFRPRRFVNGVQLHGRRQVVADRAARAALLDCVVRPLLRRYGKESAIQGWDVVNEPEWATLRYGAWRPWSAVRPSLMRSWIGEIADAVHEETSQMVTVGLASSRGLPLVENCNLDFYQVHWYDRLELRSPLGEPPLGGLDRPLLLGEFPTANSRRSAAEVVALARSAGYSGALGWSATASDPYSDLTALEEAVRSEG